MPTRKAPATSIAMPPGADPAAWQVMVSQPELDPPMNAEEEAELELGDKLRAAFQGEGAGTMRVSIFRFDPMTKDRVFMGNVIPEKFVTDGMQVVQQQFGGGEFEYRVFGRAGIVTKGRFHVAALPKDDPAPRESETAAMLRALLESQQAIMQRLANPAPAPPPVDPMVQMQVMLSMMAGMREAMGLNVAHAPAAPAQTPMQALAEAVNLTRTLKEFAKEEAPADPDNPMSMLGPIVDLVKTSMQGNAQGQQAQQNPQQGAFPSIVPPPSLEGDDDSETADNDEEMLTMIGTEFLKMAKANAPAAEAGKFIYQHLPDAYVPMLKLPNWFEMLALASPGLRLHRAWVETAKAEADKLFASPPPP